MATVFGGPDVPVASGTTPIADTRVSTRTSRSDTKNIAAPSERKRTPPHIRRSVVLAAAGATAVALTYALAPGDDDGVVVAAKEPTRIPAPATPQRAAAAAPVLSSAARGEIPLAATADPFVATSFAPPPPPAPAVVAPPPPPPPKAPPLPFTFVGLLESGAGKPAAFLAHGEALLVVSAGETIAGDYRVDSLSPTEVVLTYLPLKEQQKLNAAGAKP